MVCFKTSWVFYLCFDLFVFLTVKPNLNDEKQGTTFKVVGLSLEYKEASKFIDLVYLKLKKA